jgi:hypothetical protein
VENDKMIAKKFLAVIFLSITSKRVKQLPEEGLRMASRFEH